MHLILFQSLEYQMGSQVPIWSSVPEFGPCLKAKAFPPPFSLEQTRTMWWTFTICTIIRKAFRLWRYAVSILAVTGYVADFGSFQSSDYQVDRLFNMDSTTEEIYEELVVDLVPYAWNGGVGTLFAYGQTGSGKTFTISRVEELVAETIMNGNLEGEREVYMTIIDLAGNAAFDLLNEREPIFVREDSLGATQMVGAQEDQVFNVDDMRALVERATSFRRTAPTLMNPASSRSHAICRIRIRDTANGSDGLLYLVDLAGSEAARDVAVHGADRMRETKQINISLSVLKDCIRAKAEADTATTLDREKLGQKVPHIPFRQSALTRLLKHVFDPASTRACRTIVIACVNPSLADVGPTKNTLRFAELLRVLVPVTDEGGTESKSATHWTNTQLKDWIKENVSWPHMPHHHLEP